MPECFMCQKYAGANCSYDLCLLQSLPTNPQPVCRGCGVQSWMAEISAGSGWTEPPPVTQSQAVSTFSISLEPLQDERNRKEVSSLNWAENEGSDHTPPSSVVSGYTCCRVIHMCRFKSAVTDELAVRMQPEPVYISVFRFICHRADQLMQNREMHILH